VEHRLGTYKDGNILCVLPADEAAAAAASEAAGATHCSRGIGCCPIEPIDAVVGLVVRCAVET
jgi:hypothetical protein